jgi:hypothetical protein
MNIANVLCGRSLRVFLSLLVETVVDKLSLQLANIGLGDGAELILVTVHPPPANSRMAMAIVATNGKERRGRPDYV